MNNKYKLLLIKICINMMKYIAILNMAIFMVLLLTYIELQNYNNTIIARIFLISMIMVFMYIKSLNIILSKYNIKNTNEYKNHISDMIYLINTLDFYSCSTLNLIIIFSLEIAMYAIWWWKIDVDITEASSYYILMAICTAINIRSIDTYNKNFKFFNKRLHDEVFK